MADVMKNLYKAELKKKIDAWEGKKAEDFQYEPERAQHMQNLITRFIHFYNYHRLHMSIGYKTPAVAHLEQGVQEKMWKNKIYPKKDSTDENNVVSLPSRTNSPGEGVCQRT